MDQCKMAKTTLVSSIATNILTGNKSPLTYAKKAINANCLNLEERKEVVQEVKKIVENVLSFIKEL